MLFDWGMKSLLIVCALATPAFAGPDLTTHSPKAKPLAASSGTREIGPLDDVVFAHDSATLSDADFTQIAAAARWLNKHEDQRVVLEGYADSTGYFVYNEDLSTRRAFMVRQQLIANGVAPDRIIVAVYGELAALGGANPLDRRVVMYATKLSPRNVSAASLDKKLALSVTWTQGGALFTESRGKRGRTTTVIGTR